jgi:hypothetical protein
MPKRPTQPLYSPECVEVEFSEVHIQHPAYPRSIGTEDGLFLRPRTKPFTLHVVVLHKNAAGWMKRRNKLRT